MSISVKNLKTARRTVEQWRPIEFSFSVIYPGVNQYYILDMEGIFVGPNGEQITRPGYWTGHTDDASGGEVWKISVAPSAVGEWTLSDVIVQDISYGLTDTFTCTAYTGDKEIYQHGFLKTVDGEKHLSYDDGTPFYWLGDTHWHFAIYERWDESNKEGFDSQFRGMVDRREEQEYTIYQSNLIGNMPIESNSDANGFFVAGTNFELVNTAFFDEDLDRKMQYIADAGMVNVLAYAWCWFLVDDYVAQMKRFARYIVARYGALPHIWSIVGEAAGYDPTVADLLIERWGEVAAYTKEISPESLVTIHYTTTRPLPTYYFGEPWLDFVLAQMGHGDYDMRTRYYRELIAEFPDIVLIEGEAMYDGLMTLEYPSRRKISSQMVRNAAYRAMQSGCRGYTYGAQGIWGAVWDSAEVGNSFWGDQDWKTAIDQESGQQMTYLKHFYQSLPWTELNPDYEICVTETGALDEDTFAPDVTVLDDLSVIVVHCSDLYSDLRVRYKLIGLPSGSYSVKLFNPRTGETEDQEAVTVSSEGEFLVPSLPTVFEDWIYVFELQ